MDRIATEQADIYRCRTPEGLRVPFLLTPEAVEDGILGGKEVAQAVLSLKRGRSGGPLGMRAEYLK